MTGGCCKHAQWHAVNAPSSHLLHPPAQCQICMFETVYSVRPLCLSAACFFHYDLKSCTKTLNKDFWCCTCTLTLTCGSDKPRSESENIILPLIARRKQNMHKWVIHFFATPVNIFVAVVLHHRFKTNKVARGYRATRGRNLKSVLGTGRISMKTSCDDDVAMTTGRLSVQPGFWYLQACSRRHLVGLRF